MTMICVIYLLVMVIVIVMIVIGDDCYNIDDD